MLFTLNEKDVREVQLPFTTFVEKGTIDKFTLRLSYYRHPTLVFEIPHSAVRVKEFFMDWFYYGFPKSQMISAGDFYEPVEYTKVAIKDQMYPLFTGKDYSGSMSSCIFVEGTCLEIRHPKNRINDVIRLLEHMNPLSTALSSAFYKRSFYCNAPGTVFWFEEERMNRLKWSERENLDIGEYKLDSYGELHNVQKVLIFRNLHNDYAVLDVSVTGTGIKNLKYNFFGENTMFAESERGEDFVLGTLSDIGPVLGQFKVKNQYATVTIPRVKDFKHGSEQIMHMLKTLRNRDFFGKSEIQI